MTFEQELEELINRYSKENESNTPDFILAEYILNALNAFNVATNHRETWYGRINQSGTNQLDMFDDTES